MMRFFLTCLGADLRASLAQPGDILAQLGFFVMITALFVLAAGPEGDRLALIGLAGLWMAALASMVPAFDRLYEAEARSGWLDQLLVSPQPLWIFVLAKVAGYYISHAVPLLLASPLMMIWLSLPLALLPVLLAALGLGLAGLILLGALGAALTLGARRGAILAAILVLPLSVPLLIFGVLAGQAALSQSPAAAHLQLLAAAVLFLLVIMPLATGFALRTAAENG